eukprot:TRINITY_DN504_c0_g4_i1.p1 TRINITY_DN504_c0_g4~~TRINITY_DN504_c0_g4_i1.p1  ORF type:complete len:392 (-),score=132.69 TRINITY_DN504_c0_g4_i1:325-1500(-)
MKKDYEILNTQLPNIASTPGADKFKNVMTPFVEKVGKVVSVLETSLKQANETYVEVCKFYGENDKTLAPEVLFGTISNFAASFQRIDRELTEKATPKTPKAPKQNVEKTGGIEKPRKAENVDELVEGLKGGDVFKKRRTVRASKILDAQKLKNIIPPEGKDNIQQPAGEGASPWGQKMLRPAPPQRQSTSPSAAAALTQKEPLKDSLGGNNNNKDSGALSSGSGPNPASTPPTTSNAAGPAGRGLSPRPPVPGRVGLANSSAGKPTTPTKPVTPPPSTPPPSTPPPPSPSAAERSLSPLRTPPPVPQSSTPSRPISALSPRNVNPNQKVEVPHCRVLYDFVKEHDGELPLKKGDIVFLRKRLDSLWLEGQQGGQVGAFPANYVEIIVDLPY